MIDLTDVASGILNGYSYKVYSRLQSYLGDIVLAEDIPAVDVLEEADSTIRVPERLTFRVPIEDDQGNIWSPTESTDPLSWHGQKIVAQVGVGVGNGGIEWVNRGTFLINSADSDTDAGAVSVEALGLLALLDEATLPTEYQPKASATLGSILRAMVEPGITVDLDDAPTDRTAPTGITWSDNRLDNVYNVLDSWPAYVKINEEGFLEVLDPIEDPTVGDVVLTLTDGAGGTVMQFGTSGSRENAYNGVVAKGQYPDTHATKAGQEIIQTVYDLDPDSPLFYGGPFSPYLKPYGFASPLMTTPTQVLTAGQTRMATIRRQTSKSVQVTCVPHPGVQPHDAVLVTSERLQISGALGRVESFRLPHQAEGGAMSMVVRLVNG